MSDRLARLFHEYDRGRISRRQLLQALGLAVAVRPLAALAQGQGQRRPARARRPPGPATDASRAALRADRMEDRPARSLFMCGRGLPEGGRVLRRADELENPERRREAGGARHRRWGGLIIRGGYVAPPTPPPLPRRLQRPRAPPRGRTAGSRRRRGRRAPRQRRVRRLLLGHRAVGYEEGRSGAQEARLESRRRQSEERLPELPREGSGRLRSADQQRQHEESPQGAANGKTSAPAPFEAPAGRPCSSITSPSRCTNYKETVAFYNALLGWKLGRDEGSQN